MELTDPYQTTMVAVLLVHGLGVVFISDVFALLLFSLFVVIMAVHAVRSP
ncbi:hypothetical protein ACFRJ9_19645 [Paenarthrobacter sp. NPDC056912]